MTDYGFHQGVYSASPWKEYHSDIEKVVVENGVTRIGNSAFEFFYNLKEVTIADSVTFIGEYAFYWCPMLKEINLPK